MALKDTLKAVPIGAWVVIAAVLIIGIFWFSDDVSNWWETRKQSQFDAKIAEQDRTIEALTKEKNALIVRAETAELNEQKKMLEVEVLRAEADKRGINVEQAQKQIDQAIAEGQQNTQIIEQYKSGQIGKLEFCQWQCKISAEEGYPCRPNACDQYK